LTGINVDVLDCEDWWMFKLKNTASLPSKGGFLVTAYLKVYLNYLKSSSLSFGEGWGEVAQVLRFKKFGICN